MYWHGRIDLGTTFEEDEYALCIPTQNRGHHDGQKDDSDATWERNDEARKLLGGLVRMDEI